VELERGIVGMAGYLRWALANGLSVEAMLETLAQPWTRSHAGWCHLKWRKHANS